jgi:hypothetical protein
LPSNYVFAIAIDGHGGTNGLEQVVEVLQSLMELIGLFITLQILACLITEMFYAIAVDRCLTNGLEQGAGVEEVLQSLMELIGLFITLQILDCLITMFWR